ncbi:MAG TPA: TonB-dependent receptor, partial [bacterium]|nr:TonB-dependent receptor [bacterium]
MQRSYLWYNIIAGILICLVVPLAVLVGQTTGKIAGTVTDAETNEPLPGVNVILEGTQQGAATDEEGFYTILNVEPGSYSVTASMIGYQQITKTGVEVTLNHTSTVNFQLQTTAIAGEAITVEAEREVVKLDMSSSSVSTTPEEIEGTPTVTNVGEMINLQAGIDGMSVRGGSADETAFMLDGLMVVDNRASEPLSNLVNLSAVQSLEVIKGGFNAEYG